MIQALEGFGQFSDSDGDDGTGEVVLLYGSSGHDNWIVGMDDGGTANKISTGLELEIEDPGDSAEIAYVTVDQYDLSEFDTITIQWTQSGSGGYSAGSSLNAYADQLDSRDDADPVIESTVNDFDLTEETFDISGVSSSRHIALVADDRNGVSAAHSLLTVEQVELDSS